jgi:hypothetical protein
MLCQQANPSIIFLCCSRAKDSQRFPELPCKHESILLSHYVQAIALPCGSFAASLWFIFFIDEKM